MSWNEINKSSMFFFRTKITHYECLDDQEVYLLTFYDMALDPYLERCMGFWGTRVLD